jgi:TatD DNase family protein
MLVDSHCHLLYPRQDDLSSAHLVQEAKEAGVTRLLTIATQHREFADILLFSQQQKGVFCTYGIHPHHAGEEGLSDSELAEAMRQAAREPKVIGLGETGLDYHYEQAPRAAQQHSFQLHLRLAQEVGLPVIIHTREAEEDTMRLVDQALAKGPLTLIFHCFTGSSTLADFAIERGIYFGFGGVLTFKKSDALRDIAARVPEGLMLLETDSPYLAPVPYRGKQNRPAWIIHTAACLAEVRGVPADDVARVTTENFEKVFFGRGI